MKIDSIHLNEPPTGGAPPHLMSSESSRFCTSVVPSASAASSSMRLDRDLEPGSLTTPLIFFTG